MAIEMVKCPLLMESKIFSCSDELWRRKKHHVVLYDGIVPFGKHRPGNLLNLKI
jgi:hypothetical protein